MQEEALDTKVVRLEERVIGLDKKIDYHAIQNEKQHEGVSKELCRLSDLIEQTTMRQTEEIKENRSDINENKKQTSEHHDKLMIFDRDKKWVLGIFGLGWALLLAYVEYRIR